MRNPKKNQNKKKNSSGFPKGTTPRQSQSAAQKDLDHVAPSLLIPEQAPVEVPPDLASTMPITLPPNAANYGDAEARNLSNACQELEDALWAMVCASVNVVNNPFTPQDLAKRILELYIVLIEAHRRLERLAEYVGPRLL